MDPRSALDPDTLEDANQKILSPVAMPNGLSPGMKLGVLGIGLSLLVGWGFDQSGSSQGFVGPVFRERLKGSRGGFDGHKLFEFGNPDAFGFEIRLEVARGDGCDVHADTAFFLRETATMDFGSANGLGPSDAALSRHKMDGRK
jgi:hypothetical protein